MRDRMQVNSMYTSKVMDRFFAKVSISEKEECWIWTGATRRVRAYGHMKVNGRNIFSHRISWEAYHNEELGDRMCLHTCDNQMCCNPLHLYAGDAIDNSRDRHLRRYVNGFHKDFGKKQKPLSDWQIFVLRRVLLSGVSQKELVKMSDLHPNTISKIAKDQTRQGLWPASATDTDFLAACRKRNKKKICSP